MAGKLGEILRTVLENNDILRILRLIYSNSEGVVFEDIASALDEFKKIEVRGHVKKLVELGLIEEKGGIYFLSDKRDSRMIFHILEKLGILENHEISKIRPKGQEFLKKVHEYGKICTIVVHHNADPDAVGSAVALALALKQINIQAKVVAPLGMSAQSKKLLRSFPYPIQENFKNAEWESMGFFVVVDTGSSTQLPDELVKFLKTNKNYGVIDHHSEADLTQNAAVSIVDKNARATAVIVQILLKALNIKITKEISVFLAAGIIADTGFLRSATNRELLAICELVESGVNISTLMKVLHVEKDYSEKVAMLKALRRAELYSCGELIMAFTEIGSYEAAAALTLVRVGADIAIAANIQKNEIRISCRMRQNVTNYVNMLELFKHLENVLGGKGGGHPTAVSFNGKIPENWENAKKILLKKIEEKIGEKIKKI